jgi:integrase
MGLYAHDIDTDVDTRKPKGGTMPRTLRAPKLETRTARLKLPIAKRPYWTQIGTGISLGYRRNAGPGTWSVRVAHAGGHWSEVIATADDYTDANGATVMDYWQAADKVRTIGQSARYGGHSGKLGTVLEALDAYEATLRTRGADVGNANRVRMYLPAALAAKAVATLTLVDFKAWRAALTKAGLTPAAANRTNAGFRAALNLAAAEDERIANTRIWQRALANARGAGRARNVILDETQIRAVIAAAYEQGPEFGLLIELAATTGARVSQLSRIEVRDLQADRADPRLLMPASRKGNGDKRIERRPVPIPTGLAARLRAGAAGRAITAPLLVKPTGDAWQKSNHGHPFARAAKRAGLNPAEVTIYALRHSSITRQLLAGVPTRLVAALHDTSIKMIEHTYNRHIADHSDTIARRALLDLSAPAGANVVPLAR